MFAEAKLGHCNASEEIDNTRFWDWQQSPIPHMAPEIAPTQPVTPQPLSPVGLTPTPFPQSLINIVNPPSAPDPQGMTAALTALATANIFRDMSGLGEVSDLLKKLSDNSVAIAGVAQNAATAGVGGGKGVGGSSSGAGRSASGSSPSGIGGPRARPTEPSMATRDLHDLQDVLERAQERGLTTPAVRRQDIFTQAARDTFTSNLRLGFAVDADGRRLSSTIPGGVEKRYSKLQQVLDAARNGLRPAAERAQSSTTSPLQSWN